MTSPFRYGPVALNESESTHRPPSNRRRFGSPFTTTAPSPGTNGHFYSPPPRPSDINSSNQLGIETEHSAERSSLGDAEAQPGA